MATKQAVFGSAGSRNRFSTPVSIGITMGANEYPSGTISFDNISTTGAYWYNASGTMQHTETFYLCDSAGSNKVELFTLTIPAGSSNSGIGKTATISAADGKKLKGKALYLVATNSSYPGYSYIGLANQTTITINYALDSFAVTVNAGTGGTATASAASAVPGSTITITCSPSTGYSSNTPTASGITFTPAGANKWTFTMPNSNVTVSCTFTHIAYTVSVSSSPAAGGTLTTNKATAYYGDTVTLSRSAATGYQFSSWTKNPSGLNINSSLQFTMPAQNVSITALWTKVNYNITKTDGTGGTSTLSKTTANYGDVVTITCTPGTGYRANTPTTTTSGVTITADGTNKWKFTMPAGGVTISCTYSKISYTITVASYPSGAGTVTANKYSANYGDTITLSQTAGTGYYFNGWTASPSVTISNNAFSMPAGNITITANYLKRSTASVNTASMNGGGTITLTIVPDKSSYSHKYKLSFGANMETGWIDVAAGTTSVTVSVPIGWSDYIPSAASKSGGTMTVQTYNGSTNIGSYQITGLTYNVPGNVLPTVGTITTTVARTIGGTTYANVGDYYVQGKCGVRIQATGAGARSSTISKIEVTISGYTDNAHNVTVNSGSVDFTSGMLTASGTATITVKVTDSRGRTATATKNITVTAYNKPSGTLSVRRVDNGRNVDPLGTYATYNLTKNYTQVGSNTLSWSLKSQNVTSSSPADSGDLLPGNRQTFGQSNEYNIELILTDAFETVTIVVTLPTAQFMIYVNGTGDRVALMKATNDTLDKRGKNGTIEFSANHQIYIGTVTLEDYIRGVINGTIT